MIRDLIVFVVSNFTLTFVVIGLIFSAAALARAPRPVTSDIVIDRLLSWHLFWAIGVAYFYNFVMHGFFGETAARFIGWADSPFQFEVATASLGFSAVGFLAAFGSFDRRLMAVTGPSLFTLGAAAGHIYQMIHAHNFAPGNAGVIFYSDIIIPLIGFTLLWLQRRSTHRARIPSTSSH